MMVLDSDSEGESGRPSVPASRLGRLLVKIGSGGKDETDRKQDMRGGAAGASPPAIGGSSGGHSDQKASRGPEAGEKVAGGHSRAERRDGDE